MRFEFDTTVIVIQDRLHRKVGSSNEVGALATVGIGVVLNDMCR